jgi:hypothetical protein
VSNAFAMFTSIGGIEDMKTPFIPTIVGLSIGLVSLAVVPVYAGGGRGG